MGDVIQIPVGVNRDWRGTAKALRGVLQQSGVDENLIQVFLSRFEVMYRAFCCREVPNLSVELPTSLTPEQRLAVEQSISLSVMRFGTELSKQNGEVIWEIFMTELGLALDER